MSNQMTTYSRWRVRWAPLAAVAAAFLIVGCYTILKHPVTSEEGPQGQLDSVHPQEYYRQNCIECHSDYAEFPYGYFYGDYPDYYFEYPRWGYYYAYPWWWDRHWYDAGDGEGEIVTEGEKAQRRGSLIPPYVTGAPAINTGGMGGGGGYSVPGGAGGGKGHNGGSTGAGGTQTEKTRVRMSGSTDSTATSTESKDTVKAGKAKRGGSKKP
ncbi:MAG TPA: hypothetical protein VNN55_11950 [bacterium]|nr:hypothetical protein [bacterium]